MRMRMREDFSIQIVYAGLLIVNLLHGVVGCGSSLTGSSGEITSPSYPNSYSNNLNCVYTIDAGSTLISLRFEDFNTEYPCDTVKVYDQNNILLEDLSGAREPYEVQFATYYRLNFTTDGSVVSTGFKATWSATSCDSSLTGSSGVITSPFYPNVYSNHLNCVYTIDAGSTLIGLRFKDFNTQANRDTVKVYDQNNILLEDLSGALGRYEVQFATYYRLVFNTDGSVVSTGFKATWSGCGGSLTGVAGKITSPFYPNSYSNNLNCVYTINADSTLISLQFEDFNTQANRDTVQVYNQNNILLEDLSGAVGRYEVQFATYYRLNFTTDGSVVSTGFKATWSGCDSSLTGSSGEITSPFYPNVYSNNLTCVFTIDAGSTLISLRFEDFNTQTNRDTVMVYNQNSILLEDLSGAVGGYEVQYATYYRLVFTTDGSVVSTGFKATWSATSCDNSLTGSSGEITSPFYPHVYIHNLTCVFTIDAGSTLISLRFKDFNTEANRDTVKVYNQNNILLEDLSGAMGRYEVQFATYYRLVFTTDGSVVSTGFKATWSVAPSSLLPATATFLHASCIHNKHFARSSTSGLSFRCLERFSSSSLMECIQVCMQKTACTALSYLGSVCAHYESGTGGNNLGVDIWIGG